jgi:hypothetical protein
MGDFNSGVMGVSALTQMFSAASSGYSSASAIKAQGNYKSAAANANAKLSNLQAEDAIARGDKAVMDHGKAVRALIGKQRANFAGQGIDVGSGSAAAFQNESDFLGSLDALTLKNNAARESLGYRIQGINYRAQGEFDRLAAKNAARTTLLTGGLSALGYGLHAASYFPSPPTKNLQYGDIVRGTRGTNVY